MTNKNIACGKWIIFWHVPYTAQYNYKAVNRVTNIHKRHPIARPLWRSILGSSIWLIFCLSSCSHLRNILLYTIGPRCDGTRPYVGIFCKKSSRITKCSIQVNDWFNSGAILIKYKGQRESVRRYACIHLLCYIYRHDFLLDSFTVSLHSSNGRYLLGVMVVQGDCEWPVQNGGPLHWPCRPRRHYDWGIPYLHFDQAITNAWCQPDQNQ